MGDAGGEGGDRRGGAVPGHYSGSQQLDLAVDDDRKRRYAASAERRRRRIELGESKIDQLLSRIRLRIGSRRA